MIICPYYTRHRDAARSCRSRATKRVDLNGARAGKIPCGGRHGALALIERAETKEQPSQWRQAKAQRTSGSFCQVLH